MSADTSKATGRPWAAGPVTMLGWTIVHENGDTAAAATTPINAALIVERVNGWDALVAERDALREALEDIESRSRMGEGSVGTKGALAMRVVGIGCVARAALGKGGAA